MALFVLPNDTRKMYLPCLVGVIQLLLLDKEISRSDDRICVIGCELLQYDLAVRICADGVTETGTQAFHNGSLQQKVCELFWLMYQDFIHQVFGHIDMAAGKGLNEAAHITTAFHGDGCQLQAGDPTLSRFGFI